MWPGMYPRLGGFQQGVQHVMKYKETDIVKQTLIQKSQEQSPVTNAAAAGGNMMATRMRRISEPLTGMVKTVCMVVNVKKYVRIKLRRRNV